jgi:lincosamide nucleotidyltransferase A/C/D/E
MSEAWVERVPEPEPPSGYTMPSMSARTLVAALEAHGVTVVVGGGWAVDGLVGRETREHADLDIWVDARDTHTLFVAFAELGLDRVLPWPGDRPWNFVLHDGVSRRVDLHIYESLTDGWLHYGGVTTPFIFTTDDFAGEGVIAGKSVRCESPGFALRNHTGYPRREVDRHDVALLCETFALDAPEGYR